ncbi:hypothetical protein MAPG_06866 [Magnaporthiopsis poae ATCC 64411]|uniref:Uncharacterized protein n=1 Tax=Magnaporthiopsis poae (strain ATCC 64411 / 73-15) TaxID=644358 RepID=A0A0C4E373_MAGP6|nr:hypothetical protein MAPG_06866 [Magnaporthiopsis poae ATCC 64411]
MNIRCRSRAALYQDKAAVSNEETLEEHPIDGRMRVTRRGCPASETLLAAQKVLHGCGVRRRLSSSDLGAGARPGGKSGTGHRKLRWEAPNLALYLRMVCVSAISCEACKRLPSRPGTSPTDTPNIFSYPADRSRRPKSLTKGIYHPAINRLPPARRSRIHHLDY